MNTSPRTSTITPTMLAYVGAWALMASTAAAVDHDLRIVPQITIGTVGVEPGLALEWRCYDRQSLIIRPEISMNDDGRIGAGGAVLYDASINLDLPKYHAIAVGPRVVFHNADRYSWEADAMATWGYDLVGGTRAWQHSVGVLAAVGVVRDKEHDDNDPSASAGVFYSFRF
jgi:hypothetical protein